jgi:acyl-CoA synthetase (AMP-forming)/AMP-acid ligase II
VSHLIVEGQEYDNFLGPVTWPGVTVEPEAPAVILYTGGTTGASKGVLLSHRNVMANAFDEIIDTDMEPDDITLLIAPMYHSASLLCWFLPHLVIGACSIFMRHFDEDRAGQMIETEHVTNAFFIPNTVRRMLITGAWKTHARILSTSMSAAPRFGCRQGCSARGPPQNADLLPVRFDRGRVNRDPAPTRGTCSIRTLTARSARRCC